MAAGANVATVIMMFLSGFSDYWDPVRFPVLSCTGLAFPVFLAVNMAFLFFWLAFKRIYMSIPLVGYLACYVPLRIYMPLNLPEDMPEDVIKVLTYNVENYTGDPRYEDGFSKIYTYIKESKADIVCIQEDNSKLFAAMRDSVGAPYAYYDTTGVGNASVKMNWQGIYSRFPILKKETIGYTSKGNGSVAYYLKIDNDTVIVVNNHFESNHLSPDEREMYKDMIKGDVETDTVKAGSKIIFSKLVEAVAMRAPQADSVHQYIENHKEYPVIVCGDFNDNPISYTRRTVAKGLVDCYVETGRGIGLSYNRKGFFVRIDNIFCSDKFKAYNCKVDNEIDASDHYPMYCWLRMVNKNGKKP